MKKKFLALMMVAAMAVVSVVGCGKDASDNKTADTDKKQDTQEVSVEEPADEENQDTEEVRHKIGVILYGKDDSMGAADYAY